MRWRVLHLYPCSCFFACQLNNLWPWLDFILQFLELLNLEWWVSTIPSLCPVILLLSEWPWGTIQSPNLGPVPSKRLTLPLACRGCWGMEFSFGHVELDTPAAHTGDHVHQVIGLILGLWPGERTEMEIIFEVISICWTFFYVWDWWF